MSETLSYQTIRSANLAREADELKLETRKKNLLILVLQYLNENGYIESAQMLGRETNLDLNRFDVCDNVDLETVLMEYESYYYIKFSRYPKITKKLSANNCAEEKSTKNNRPVKLKRENSIKACNTPCLPRIPHVPETPPSGPGRPRSGKKNASDVSRRDSNSLKNGHTEQKNGNYNNPNSSEPLTLQGIVLNGNSAASHSETAVSSPYKQTSRPGQIIDIRSMINEATQLNIEEGNSEDRLLKPLGGYTGYTQEWRDLAQTISREIYSKDPNVRWTDIIGLEAAKRLVKEAVVYPIKYPQLFTGILSPWKGLLLYGPPGTGKTLLAKAVATECNTTFFNISASSIVSKWRGDSEKLVRVLFELARFHAPSTIFIDELESIMSQRGSGGSGEHEGSRRMKTELLIQMDGLSKSDDLVFLLAASNLPWELDHAMLRRLEKRILVDLPTPEARRKMFEHHLPRVVHTNKENGLQLHSDLDYSTLAQSTEGYSGSDIRLVCKEAAMRPVRKIFDALENHTEGNGLQIHLDTVKTEDVMSAIKHTKSSTKGLVSRYLAWQKDFESV